MKKTQLTDILRLVTHNKGFFVTMAVVIALTVASYGGIKFATVSLFDSCEDYFDEYELFDLELASVYGFDDQALKEIQETEGVDKIGTQYDTHALIKVDQDNYVAEFYTRPGDLNKERLTEGRLPEAANECVVEKAFTERFGYEVGDKVTLSESSDMLTNGEYTIVGIAELVTVFVNDDYYNRGSSSIGDGQVTTKILVADSGFTSDAIKQICFVTMKDRPDRDSDEYTERVNELSTKLLSIVEAGDWRIYNKTVNDMDSQISDALSEYEEGTAELEEAMSLLSYYESQLAQGKIDYASGMEQYEQGASALAAAKAEIDYEQSRLDAARAELDSAKTQLESAKTELEEAESTLTYLAAARDQAYEYMQECEEGSTEYEIAKYVYEQASSTYETYYAEYQTSLAEYEASYAEYVAGEEEYSAAEQELSAAWSEYYSSANTLAAYKAELDAAASEITSSESELDSQRSSISQGESQLYEMNAAIIEAQQTRAGLPWTRSFVADLTSNTSYFSYSTMEEGATSVIAMLCSLFMIIAILICYTAVSRMVTEDHRIIGTQKALGVRAGEIYAKYVLFVVSATLVGIALGVILAYGLFEDFVIYSSYNDIFIMRDFTPIVIWPQVLLIALLAIAVMTISAFVACRSMVGKETVVLLNDSIRDSKSTDSFGAGSRLSLDLLSVLRTLRSNPQVLITTLVSVAGTAILLIVVLTVRSSMAGIADRQFNELQGYEGIITVDSGASTEDKDALTNMLTSYPGVEILPVKEQYVSYTHENTEHYASLIALDQTQDPSDFLTIRDADTLEALEVPKEGVLICLKIAEEQGYEVGDAIALSDDYGSTYEATVTGVFDRNIGFAMICSKSYYDKITNTSDGFSQYYIAGSDENVESAVSKARTYPAYFNYTNSQYYADELETNVESVNAIVIFIFALSVLLSLFVLLNMAQMNIRKKTKDIIVMKVLGVPLKRIKRCVFMETMIMCCLGLVLGIVVGAPLGSSMSVAMELDNLIGIRGISLSAIVIGAVVNFLIFTVINALSLRGVGRVKMTGSAREA